MGKEKKLLDRMAVIKSIRKMTQAMKMVSIAKRERAKGRLRQVMHVSAAVGDMVRKTLRGATGGAYDALFMARPLRRVMYVVLTSDKGLCGGFNAVVLRRVKELRDGDNGAITFLPIGGKGRDFLARNGDAWMDGYVDLLQHVSLAAMKAFYGFLLGEFVDGRYDAIKLVYRSRAQAEEVEVATWLPLVEMREGLEEGQDDSLYEPSRGGVLDMLVPSMLTLQLYERVLEHQVAEHSARMLAMHQATDNAADLVRKMRLRYNRVRQATITRGIIEVVSGLQC